MYKLYTDKNENFSADISVKNASLKNSVARLVVETPGINLVFPGTIEEQKCIIPIKKLKGIIEENTTGKMYLEIIVEDVYFKPWESQFVVEEHTSMKVVVKEQKEETTKPVLEVKVSEKKEVVTEVAAVEQKPATQPTNQPQPKKIEEIKQVEPKLLQETRELVTICEKMGIKKHSLDRGLAMKILKEYFKETSGPSVNKENIIREFFTFMGTPLVKK